MALSMLVAIIAAPALLGTQEAIRQSQSKEKREEHRARRCNLIASCVSSSGRSREINGRPVVLREGKLWIDTGISDGAPFGHPFAGYYLPYPDSKYEGLVTTITDVAPIMNWVYIDRDTHEVKYGVRVDAQPNLTGPFDCTRQDRRLTFDAWEGWCAVEEVPNRWALYYDLDDNGLQGKVREGTRVLELELTRKEKRFKKEGEARLQDQTTQRAVDATGDAPVEEPIAVKPEEKAPGVWGAEAEQSNGLQVEERQPFIIPKMSLFQDLPYSVTQVPPQPPTPPPAYSSAATPFFQSPRPDPPRVASPENRRAVPPSLDKQPDLPPPVGEPAPVSPTSMVPQKRKQMRPPPKTPPDQRLPGSYLTTTTPTASAAMGLPQRPTPLKTKPSYEQQRSPPAGGPSSREPSPNADASNGKRTTPKLNRNSGSRALAQAQMFEAWARGEPTKDNASRTDIRSSPRPASAADSSASDYSNAPKTGITDILGLYSDRPESTFKAKIMSSPPPVPPIKKDGRKRSSIKKGDPAVFGGFISPPDSNKEQVESSARKGRISAEYTIKRKSATLDENRPKEPDEVPPSGPGKFRRQPSQRNILRATGSNPRLRSPEKISRSTDSQASPNGVRPTPNSARTGSPEFKRQPSSAMTRPKAGSRESRPGEISRSSPSAAPPLPRSGSVSSLQSQNDPRYSPTPRPLARTNTSSAQGPRRGMTATMTSGTRNRAMTLRVSQNEGLQDSPRPGRNRSNSSLMREIDDLVGVPERNRNGAAPPGKSREGENGPTLRRSGTTRVQGAGRSARESPRMRRDTEDRN